NYLSGTSMAAPFVTGTVALVQGLHPTWSYSQIINQIVTTASENGPELGRSIAGGIVNAAGAVAPVYPASASFLGTDTIPQGNWKSAYGGSGYDISQDPSSNNPALPYYATLNITGGQNTTWSTATSDPRALVLSAPGSTTRAAGAWYSTTSFAMNLSL